MAGVAETHLQTESRRACQECNRKKTRCDMRRPVCGLCLRTGNTCSFPLKRKSVFRRPQSKSQSRRVSESLYKLVQVLGKASQSSGENEATNDTHELSPALLKDSLKDLLVEIRTSEAQRSEQTASQSELGETQPAVSEGDDVDIGADGIKTDEVDLSRTDHETSNPDTTTSMTTLNFENEIPCSLAADLINTFFEKVQPWLPILHRPRFQARYESKLCNAGDFMKDLSQDERLLFYSIFAMSARSSNCRNFNSISPEKRGQHFADRAREVYAQGRSLRAPSLMYLQGCILLAFYFYTSGPTHQGWLLVGVCVRMAYDLGLFEIDEDDWAPTHPVDHVEKEELRRAWWLVWELDTFASTVSRKPYAIDRKRMSVILPISDDAWFSEIRVPSTELNFLPGQSWRSLHGNANQDERAWFLVANSFMATIYDRLQQKQEVTPDEKLTLENEVCCFKLALPPSLRLDINTQTFTPSSFSRCNWVIGTHIMLMATSFMVAGIVTSDREDRNTSGPILGAMPPLRQRAIDLSRIISLWDTRYIEVAHPFYACAMLPPYAVDSSVYESQSLITSTHDLAKLVLEHFGEQWKLGKVVLEIAEILEKGGPRNAEEKRFIKGYAIFFRIPRPSSNGSAFLQPDQGQSELRKSGIGKETTYAGNAELSQQRPQPSLRGFSASTDMTAQTNSPNYEASMFGPRNYPQLPASVYDANNEIDLGFSEFFGGYQEADLCWLK